MFPILTKVIDIRHEFFKIVQTGLRAGLNVVPSFLQTHDTAMIESRYKSVQGIEAEKLFELLGDIDETLDLYSTLSRVFVAQNLGCDPGGDAVPVMDPVVQMLGQKMVFWIL